ncbi:hypothetical protein RHMOL_Rhmol04G0173300 [Rhododendron molle]|uniref:Uncharacterized protein n=1 Tax=Rhododendron molle TaxID=49168 RepID=A0ACC0P2P3_RHOML|nr:hypothetical protein RHMOL_Rhmol04G0173300 [Rhododendron molle]
MDETRYPEGFDKDPYALSSLQGELDWFKELADLKFDPIFSFSGVDRTIYPAFDSQRAKELLAAFAFLDVNILEEYVPFTNFVWACETLQFSLNSLATAHIHAFLDHSPTIKMWLKQNTTAHRFNRDLHDYEIMHHKLSKLHDRVLALEDYSFELPSTATRYL